MTEADAYIMALYREVLDPEDLPRIASDPGVDPMLREIATALLEQGR